MSVTVTLNSTAKRLTFAGTFAAGNPSEAVTVTPTLASGSLRLLDDSGAAVAECTITSGAGSMVTTGAALVAMMAGWPQRGSGRPTDCTLCDADGNLLGSGVAVLKPHACAGQELFEAAGGPLTLEAGENVAAGAPLRILEGKLRVCTASNAGGFVGLAATSAAQGANVTACRGGSLTVAGWGLTQGAAYYLPQTGAALVSDLTGVNIVRMIGIATDAATLLMTGGGLCVQAGESGTASYLVWDADARRLVALAAAAAGGAGSANKIPALDADGLLALSMMPAGVTAAAVAAVRALFADMVTLTDPSGEELTAAVNQLVTRLKG